MQGGIRYGVPLTREGTGIGRGSVAHAARWDSSNMEGLGENLSQVRDSGIGIKAAAV